MGANERQPRITRFPRISEVRDDEEQGGGGWRDLIRVIGAAFLRGLSPLIRGLCTGVELWPPEIWPRRGLASKRQIGRYFWGKRMSFGAELFQWDFASAMIATASATIETIADATPAAAATHAAFADRLE